MSALLQEYYSRGSVIGAAIIGGLGLLWLYRKLSRRRALASLQGKVVLITGASSGIGEACAHAYYRAGCKVIISARRLEELERVKKEIMAQPVNTGQSYEPQVLQMDVTDFASVPDNIRKAISFHGRIDVLVNNAGLSFRGSAVETKIEVHQKVMLVNYFGSVAVTTAVLPHMISNKSGSIIAVSSIQGKVSLPYRTAYGASKFALEAYCDGLRAEVACHNIHVGINSPSYVRTDISKNALTADNTVHGKMDAVQASGMSAEYLAERIVLQTALKEADVSLGPFVHRNAIYSRVLFPAMFRRTMRRRAEKGPIQ